MATIGDLVVNFSANSRDFDRGTSRVQAGMRSLTSFALRAATAIGGIYAVKGAIQAAASVETMAVKFKVLTKSEEKAAKVMGEITALAASTPFQKMDIADATQKLLAFGASADTVIEEVARLGDIAALTGNPIGELAELYGKARVQGRLFGEDINQLTGRGIPIIQELAKQLLWTTLNHRTLLFQQLLLEDQMEIQALLEDLKYLHLHFQLTKKVFTL